MIELRVIEETAEKELEVFERLAKSGTVFDRLDVLETKVTEIESDIADIESTIDTMTDEIVDMIAVTVDSGWKTLPLASGIVAYNEANTPQYRKIGKLVVIRGTVKGVTARNTVIGNLPDGFRPTKANPYVQNTSLATGNFATQTRLTVTTIGDVKLEAISDNAIFAADKWFPIATMFLVD